MILHDKKNVHKKKSVGYLTRCVNLHVLYLIYLLLAIGDVEPANYKNIVEGEPIDIECVKTPIKPTKLLGVRGKREI